LKRQRKSQHPNKFPKKSIYWKEVEMKNFNPDSPAMPAPNPQGNQAQLTSTPQDIGI
jgi:hypothetical protein